MNPSPNNGLKPKPKDIMRTNNGLKPSEDVNRIRNEIMLAEYDNESQ